MQNTVGIIDFFNTEGYKNINFISTKYNRSWGTDYMLMDSKSFMSGKGETDYSQIIDMYQKIWDLNGYRLIFAL